MEQWFSLLPLRAKHLPHVKIAVAQPHHDSLLVPLLTVLPMGWGWSLHVAQKIHEFHVHQAGLRDLGRIVDRRPAGPLPVDDTLHAIHVDNYCLISSDRSRSIAQGQSIAASLEGGGFPVHET